MSRSAALLFVASLLGLTQTSNGFVVSTESATTSRIPFQRPHYFDSSPELILAPPPTFDVLSTTTTPNDDDYRTRSKLMQSLYELKSGQSSRQQQRQALYRDALVASRLGMPQVKKELERTAFKLLYRRQYNKVTKQQDQSRTSMERALSTITREVRDLLRSSPELQQVADSVSVTARVKEPYSLWRKMLKTRVKSVSDVADALALRIIVDSDDDELCYMVQDLIMRKFSNIRSFKDYIANPKPNGYQSLHYTFDTNVDNHNWTCEVQVRSEEMHRVAEQGSAAHWKYKSQNVPSLATDSSATTVLANRIRVRNTLRQMPVMP